MSDAQQISGHPNNYTAEKPARLRKRLPKGRSLEQVWNHFQVERRLATALKSSDRAQRRAIYESMYDELFSLVPDHPRLTRAVDERRARRASLNKLRLVERFLDKEAVIAEIAPGDCHFLSQIAPRVKFAYGIDISDQRPSSLASPKNLRVIVYDGYDTREIPDASLDLVFSDQLIEHLHPEDTADHFRLVRRLLKPGGRYIFRTPHALTGPHDVSEYFSDEALGFHLKEWTYTELDRLLQEVGFREWKEYWARNRFRATLPKSYFRFWESALTRPPKRIALPIAKLTVPTIEVVAQA